MFRYYLLMISGFLFLIFPLLTGCYLIETQMGQDTNQEALTHKETSTWSRMPDMDDELHTHHNLCDGYYGLLGVAGDGDERKAKISPPAAIKKHQRTGPISALLIKSENKGKGSVNSPIIKYDATDDQSEARSQCMARKPFIKKPNIKSKEKDKDSFDWIPFDESRKIQETDKRKSEGKSSMEKGEKKYEEQDRENTLPEKNKMFIRKYKGKPKAKPSAVSSMSELKLDDLDNGLKFAATANSFPLDAKTQRIVELNRIYNEYLKAWDDWSPIALPEMKTSSKSFTCSGLNLNALTDLLNVVDHFQQGNLVDDLAKTISQEMDPHLSRQINQDAKLASDSRASLSRIIKNDLSGLLENMKPSSASTAFQKTLADLHSRRSQIKAGQLYDEYKKGFCKIFSDHKYPRQLAEKDEETECQNTTNTSEVTEECHGKKNNYMKALQVLIKMSKDSNQNGGSKPYYIPMSKSRQLVHNDIPLVKTKSAQKADPPKDFYSGLNSKYIANGIQAIKNASFFNLVDEYQKQVESLNQALKNKQGWWKEAEDKEKSPYRKPSKRNTQKNNAPYSKPPKRNIYMNNQPGLKPPEWNMPMNNPGQVPFPEVLVNQAPQMPVNVLGNMASQMNVSPIEMAQRIVGAGQAPPAAPPRFTVPQVLQSASLLGGGPYQKVPENTGNIPWQQQDPKQQQDPQQKQQQKEGLSPVLDKILQRLETIQATKCNKSEEVEPDKNLPCCFVDPADGAPCELNGSWESLVLGVRINIKSAVALDKGQPKPSCSHYADHRRLRRQCAKINPATTKKINADSSKSLGIPLNVSVQETVPPRAHELLDNLTDWQFFGNAQSILGGPISLSFRKQNSNLIGHFVGYCRNCGCLDTIFGSWTFCQPSRDCQDISMSIVDRRDMLRRYSMDERRKNRYKEQLFLGSKFAKMEEERLRNEQEKAEKHPTTQVCFI